MNKTNTPNRPGSTPLDRRPLCSTRVVPAASRGGFRAQLFVPDEGLGITVATGPARRTAGAAERDGIQLFAGQHVEGTEWDDDGWRKALLLATAPDPRAIAEGLSEEQKGDLLAFPPSGFMRTAKSGSTYAQSLVGIGTLVSVYFTEDNRCLQLTDTARAVVEVLRGR